MSHMNIATLAVRCPFHNKGERLYPMVGFNALGCRCGYQISILALFHATRHCLWFGLEGEESENLQPLLALPKDPKVWEIPDFSRGAYYTISEEGERRLLSHADQYGRYAVAVHVPRHTTTRWGDPGDFPTARQRYETWYFRYQGRIAEDGIPILDRDTAQRAGIFDATERTTTPFWRNTAPPTGGAYIAATRETQVAYQNLLEADQRYVPAEPTLTFHGAPFVVDNFAYPTTLTTYNPARLGVLTGITGAIPPDRDED